MQNLFLYIYTQPHFTNWKWKKKKIRKQICRKPTCV